MSDSRSHPSGDDESLLPGNWKELAPLVDAVLDAAPERRVAVLIELSAGDPVRRSELERLVAECERDVPLLNRPAAERFDHLLGSASEAAEVPLPEMLGGRYRIERELGRGGMARVYLAHDIKHARNVAVKVIRPEFAASMGRERFLREIAIAARLRHPNIVPLYDSGDADGVLYFVMPYEEGPSLRLRLDRGALPVAECVSTLRDVARALAYAHQHGVVHRDVKPDNVMLCGGAAVVTDFGIAKAVRVAQTGVSEATLTQIGAGIGTPAYMAPEQATGDPSTDYRADIYSFGCLAYELFTGKPPFHGLPSHQIIAAHVGTKPVPITETGADVPDAIARLIARCLEKQPAARPQSAQELLTELETRATTSQAVVRHRRTLPTPALISLVVIGVMLVGGAGYLVSRLRAAPAAGELTVAVLPLTSVGGDSVQRELADGLSDEVATALFKVPGVRVMSRRGVGNYGGHRDIDPAKIGRELGARFLVMGSLREVGGRLRVLASLVDAPDGAMQWSQQFDRDQRDLGTVRDQIASGVGETLQRILGIRVGVTGATQKPAHSANPDAYRLYVLAQRALDRRGQSIQASIDNFRRASELDTLYADAISGLSLALALSPYFQSVSTRDVEAEATNTARRALRLDSALAQPYVALGLVHQHAWDWARAETDYRTAIRLDSRNVEARVQLGRHLLFRGRIAEGLEQFLSARDDDPASAVVLSWVSYAYYLEGKLDSAIVYSEHAYQSDSTNVTTLGHGALVRLKAGRVAEARAFANRIGGGYLYVLGVIGDTARVRARLREADSGGRRLSEKERFLALLGLGDTTEALAALERATEAHENWPSGEAMSDPIFDPIRASARFQAQLRKVGLPASETPVVFHPSSR